MTLDRNENSNRLSTLWQTFHLTLILRNMIIGFKKIEKSQRARKTKLKTVFRKNQKILAPQRKNVLRKFFLCELKQATNQRFNGF